MPPTSTLEAYLDEQNVKYVTMHHSAAYTAQELAALFIVHDGRDGFTEKATAVFRRMFPEEFSR